VSTGPDAYGEHQNDSQPAPISSRNPKKDRVFVQRPGKIKDAARFGSNEKRDKLTLHPLRIGVRIDREP
jgi:hypothetical protein